ncbi:MAG: hypothetical protein LBE91_00870 [Tannerella sp.]|jgi:hypothetical protein|nr:hypothetical protein [Tannerella sp.]
MRLTTKIIIGVILSIFILSLLFIIGFSFTDRKYRKDSRSFSGPSIQIPQTATTGINLDSCRVIVLEAGQADSLSETYYFLANDECGLFIRPASTSGEENKLIIPEALRDFITVETQNDTLTVRIKWNEGIEKYGTKGENMEKRKRPGSMYGMLVSGLNMYLHASNVNVINRLNIIQTKISHLEADTIKIYSTGEVLIDSCKANVIEPETREKLSITNSSAKMLNLDFDRLNNWEITNCDIKTSNYTGSGQHQYNAISQLSLTTINWRPKNKDAEFQLKIKGDSAQISYRMP